MCLRDNDSPKFIRRRDAAVTFMQRLLDVRGVLGPDAIEVTSDKFRLNASIREDYRIYNALWALIGE